jgi:hypothetical protein
LWKSNSKLQDELEEVKATLEALRNPHTSPPPSSTQPDEQFETTAKISIKHIGYGYIPCTLSLTVINNVEAPYVQARVDFNSPQESLNLQWPVKQSIKRRR